MNHIEADALAGRLSFLREREHTVEVVCAVQVKLTAGMDAPWVYRFVDVAEGNAWAKSQEDYFAAIRQSLDATPAVDHDGDYGYTSVPLEPSETVRVRYVDGGKLEPLPYPEGDHDDD